MLHVGVLALGAWFMMTAVWWLSHITARYYRCLRRNTEFQTSVTFTWCTRCKVQPLEGLVKVSVGVVLTLVEFTQDRGYPGDAAFLSRTELGTLSSFLVMWGLMDMLAHWGPPALCVYLDFAGLLLFYTALGAVQGARAYLTEQPVSSLHSLSLYVAVGSMVVTVVEGLHPHNVLCPVARSYLLLLQGSWWLHAAVLTDSSSHLGGASVEGRRDTMLLFTMIFVGHAAVNVTMVVCLWLLVGKLVERSCCGRCLDADSTPSDGVFLENRVRFNYHVLSRFDSETDEQ
ncbi:transmembrane protein 45B-like [Littorina saxatilis]|uniref:Uncharacterized protein n=1 Tax=Littorina saxatilis TaxID=31220 RepID=A0AAN9AKY6_9CAEN